MATRRIARGRGGSPVPIIILTVLLVGAVALAIVFGMKMSKLQEDIVGHQDDVKTAQQNRRSAEEQAVQFKTLVGLNLDAMQETFDKLKKDAQDTAPIAGLDDAGPLKLDTVAEVVEAYAREVAALRTIVGRLEGEVAEGKQAREQAETDLKNYRKDRDDEVARVKDDAAKARDQRDVAQRKLAAATQKFNADVAALDVEKTKLIKDVNHWKKAHEIQARKVKDLLAQIDELKHPVDIRGPLTGPQAAGEPVDGKVVTIEPDGETVMIDLGRRMEFKVYDNADPESRKVKGHVQVRKVFDSIAQCKVMEQDKLDPILPGMVIVNPAFRRGKTLHFVLVTPFREPNVEQLLSRYPCRVKKVNPSDTQKLDRETDYVITGEGRIKEGVTRPDESPTVEQAKEWQITVMRESTLLRYLGELD